MDFFLILLNAKRYFLTILRLMDSFQDDVCFTPFHPRTHVFSSKREWKSEAQSVFWLFLMFEPKEWENFNCKKFNFKLLKQNRKTNYKSHINLCISKVNATETKTCSIYVKFY